MHIQRSVISVFLLLVYSLSFAHDMIPHSHSTFADQFTFQKENNQQHKHLHHHKLIHSEEIDTNDIIHQDHIDDSIYDFLVCLLSEQKHGLSDSEHQQYIPADLKDVANKSIDKFSIISYDFDSFGQIYSSENLVHYFWETPIFKQSVYSLSKPYRGPPFLA